MQKQPTNNTLIQSDGINTSITIYSAEKIVLPKQVTRDLRDATAGMLHIVSSENNCLKFNFNNHHSENPFVGYTLNWLFQHLLSENIVSMLYLVALKHNLQMQCSSGNQIVQALALVTRWCDRSDVCATTPKDAFSNVEKYRITDNLSVEIKNSELSPFILSIVSSDGAQIKSLLIDDYALVEKMREIISRCNSVSNFSELTKFLRQYGVTSTEIACVIEKAETQPSPANNVTRFSYAEASAIHSGQNIAPVNESTPVLRGPLN